MAKENNVLNDFYGTDIGKDHFKHHIPMNYLSADCYKNQPWLATSQTWPPNIPFEAKFIFLEFAQWCFCNYAKHTPK